MRSSSRACPRDSMPQQLPPRRRTCLRGPITVRWPQDPPPRACPLDPLSRACPPDPTSLAFSQVSAAARASRGGSVTVGVVKTEPYRSGASFIDASDLVRLNRLATSGQGFRLAIGSSGLLIHKLYVYIMIFYTIRKKCSNIWSTN
jgi:hypothetical protein